MKYRRASMKTILKAVVTMPCLPGPSTPEPPDWATAARLYHQVLLASRRDQEVDLMVEAVREHAR